MNYSSIKREIVFTMNKNKIRFLVVSLLYIIISLLKVSNIKSFENNNSGINLVFELFKGVGYFDSYIEVTFPYIWLFTNTVIIYIIAVNCSIDIKNSCISIITRCGKSNYWISKTISAIMTVIVYYLLIFTIAYIIPVLLIDSNLIIDIKLIVLYISTTIMIIVIGNCLSIKIDYKYVILILVGILAVSVFINNSYFPGQQSIILRHMPYDKVHKLSFSKSIIYNSIITGIGFIFGYKLSSKKDIL